MRNKDGVICWEKNRTPFWKLVGVMLAVCRC